MSMLVNVSNSLGKNDNRNENIVLAITIHSGIQKKKKKATGLYHERITAINFNV